MSAIDAQPAADALSILVGLGQRARRARSAEELHFIAVNETHALVRYRQAVLWSVSGGLIAVSGVAAVDRNAPFALWVNGVCAGLASGVTEPRRLEANDLDGHDRAEWAEWFPPHALVLPVAGPDGTRLGLMAFARDEEWTEAEILFLDEAAAIIGASFAWWHRPRAWTSWLARLRRSPRRRLQVAAAVLLALLFPVRLSILAPGEVVARDPAVVRSPLDGVVERVTVGPNQAVREGEVLVELDTTIVKGRLDVALKGLDTARAEHEQVSQQAFIDPRAKAQLGVLAGRIEERQADVAYLTGVLDRTRVRAPRDGIAVLDDPVEWVGRPVGVGERVLAVADERDTEVEAWIAPADAMEFDGGAPVTLFLNTQPFSPVRASLRYMTYEGLPRPDGSIGHRARASLHAGEARPRLGQKGTVRIDGGSVPLIYWLLRRPIGVIRQVVGL